MESASVSMARLHAAIEGLKAEGIGDPTPEGVMDKVAELERRGDADPAAAQLPPARYLGFAGLGDHPARATPGQARRHPDVVELGAGLAAGAAAARLRARPGRRRLGDQRPRRPALPAADLGSATPLPARPLARAAP